MIEKLGIAGRTLMRMICVLALALLSISFAHKPPVVDTHAIPLDEIAQYVLPDGSLPVLCLSHDNTADHHERAVVSGCEVCRLATAIMLPIRADTFGGPISAWVEIIRHEHAEHIDRPVLSPNSSPRGPPYSATV